MRHALAGTTGWERTALRVVGRVVCVLGFGLVLSILALLLERL